VKTSGEEPGSTPSKEKPGRGEVWLRPVDAANSQKGHCLRRGVPDKEGQHLFWITKMGGRRRPEETEPAGASTLRRDPMPGKGARSATVGGFKSKLGKGPGTGRPNSSRKDGVRSQGTPMDTRGERYLEKPWRGDRNYMIRTKSVEGRFTTEI